MDRFLFFMVSGEVSVTKRNHPLVERVKEWIPDRKRSSVPAGIQTESPFLAAGFFPPFTKILTGPSPIGKVCCSPFLSSPSLLHIILSMGTVPYCGSAM